MSDYKFVKNFDGVKRVADNAFIPNHGGNRDWKEYQEWLLVDGNVTDPAQTLEEAKADKKIEIKNVANEAILEAFPEVTQRNLLARTNELLLKKIEQTITVDEEAELQANNDIWTWVKGVRSGSNATEALVDAAPDIEAVEQISFAPSPYSP